MGLRLFSSFLTSRSHQLENIANSKTMHSAVNTGSLYHGQTSFPTQYVIVFQLIQW